MKVLWFTNTPCSAVEKLGININRGSWLRSLEKELNKIKVVELAICFYTYQFLEPFKYNSTQFYPVKRKGKKNRISRLIKRIFLIGSDDECEIEELLKVIGIFKPDLIHVHGTEDNFGLLQFYTNIPIVISIQGILNPYAEKYFVGIPNRIASRYEGIIPKLLFSGVEKSYKQFKIKAKREQRILKDAKFIIGRTDWDRRISNVLAPKGKYYKGNEILRSLFYSNVWKKKQFSDTIQIVTTSMDELYKGFETIVDIAQILKEKSDFKFLWKVIGLNEKSNIVRIVKRWKGVNFQNLNIQLLGFKNEKEIVEILLGSDIYCQTSHIENSSNSLCEAMILGMPIIATSVGGTSSLLKDKEEGLLIQDGEPYSYAGAICELTQNFILAMQYAQRSRIKANITNNKQNICNDLLETYSIISDVFINKNLS